MNINSSFLAIFKSIACLEYHCHLVVKNLDKNLLTKWIFLIFSHLFGPRLIRNGRQYCQMIKNDSCGPWVWILRKLRKNFQKFFGFLGGDGLSNRFFERCTTLHNFWRLDSDRISWGLQFEPFDELAVDCGQKLLRNYENFMTKS